MSKHTQVYIDTSITWWAEIDYKTFVIEAQVFQLQEH